MQEMNNKENTKIMSDEFKTQLETHALSTGQTKWGFA